MLADADAARAQGQRVVLREGALAGQRRHHRRFEEFGQRLQLRPGLAVMHALPRHDDRALGGDQRLGDLRHRFRVGAALEARRLGVFGDQRVRNFVAQYVGRKLDQYRTGAAVPDLGEGAPQRLDGRVRHRHLLRRFGHVAEVERRVEIRLNLVDVAGIAGRQHDDRAGIAIGLRHPAKGVLGARAVLHHEDADLVARRQLADGVAHMQANALLAHHDRADVGLGRALDDRVDRIADQKFDALALEDLGDCGGDFHRGLLGLGGRRDWRRAYGIAAAAYIVYSPPAVAFGPAPLPRKQVRVNGLVLPPRMRGRVGVGFRVAPQRGF